MFEIYNKVIKQLMNQDITGITPELIMMTGQEAIRLLDTEHLTECDVSIMNMIIQISQILYNNTDRSLLLLDDGIYDLLLEKDKLYNSNYQVGAPPLEFKPSGELVSKSVIKTPIEFVEDFEKAKQGLFYDDIIKSPPIDINRMDLVYDRNSGKVINKRNTNVPHKYPKLVGTLDKCKFTLDAEARDRGVFDDNGVKIFERDFLARHMQMGLFGPDDRITLLLELKYDGVSVEADVTNKILSARTRGDTNEDLAADLTPIFENYEFPYCPDIPEVESFGIKFEAIMTHHNVEKMGMLKNRTYANGRNAIIGLLGSSDVYDYRDLITLVPLSTSLDIDPITEVEFLNKYYHSGVYLNYAVVSGTYNQVLYQVYKFVKEAEALRPMMPFMYDGVVVSYTDRRIIEALGRENSVNKYSIAIKFNTMIRQAIFTGYTYTIGQNGIITPMLHYTPVEFYGQIHTKSTGHSYARFKELDLAIGDVLDVEYRNDVMPYVTKSTGEQYWNNANPKEVFPEKCPSCGTPLVFNESGKTVVCPNIYCPDRTLSRITNMMKKLNLKDFAEESLAALHITSLYEFIHFTPERAAVLGQADGAKFMERVNEIRTQPIFDYKIIGAIGFSNIASETWKKILNKVSIVDIIALPDDVLIDRLVSIKGIGKNTAVTIAIEREQFMDDLDYIANMPNMIPSYGMVSGKSIRFTGCRDHELEAYLCDLGFDASGSLGVTKATNILIVPSFGFTSSKTSKVGPECVIVPIDEFKANLDKYLY